MPTAVVPAATKELAPKPDVNAVYVGGRIAAPSGTC